LFGLKIYIFRCYYIIWYNRTHFIIYKKNNKNVNQSLEELKKYTFVEELNSYFDTWKAVSAAIYKVGDIEYKREIYRKYFERKSKCCLPSCCNNVPFDMVKRGACNVLHYNQSCKIRGGVLTEEDYKHECLECGNVYGNTLHLSKHVNSEHDPILYYNKHVKSGEKDGMCLWCGKDMKFKGIIQGYDNFCHNTNCNVNYYNKIDNRHCCGDKISETLLREGNTPSKKEYWMRKGNTEEQSKLLVSSHQNMTSVDSIINREKCSIDEAIIKRKNMTEKWLKSFPRLKYSLVSQKLFWDIYENIKNDYSEIFFATKMNGERDDSGKNYEYKIETEKSYRFLDFYVKDVNRGIEFDGAYWHSVANKQVDYTVDKDINRLNEIKKSLPDFDVLVVKELYYYKNKQKVLEDCINFIRNG